MDFTFAVEFKWSFRISGFNNKRTESFLFSFFIAYSVRHFKSLFHLLVLEKKICKLSWLLFPKFKEYFHKNLFTVCVCVLSVFFFCCSLLQFQHSNVGLYVSEQLFLINWPNIKAAPPALTCSTLYQDGSYKQNIFSSSLMNPPYRWRCN